MSPNVSVIMPIYNTRKYLSETLNCLRSQTLKELEIIFVDDGSTDGSDDIVRRFVETDSRYKMITQPNRGAASARNAGLAVASGEYLSVLDSDDLFEDDMLEKSYFYAASRRADLVVFRADQFIDEERRFKQTSWTVKARQLPASDAFSFRDVFPNRFRAMQGWTWDKLFRREFVSRNGIAFQEQRLYNDILFTFSAYLRAGRIVFLDDILVHQRKRGGGSLSDEGSGEWGSLFSALSALKGQMIACDQYAYFERDFVNYVIWMVLYHLSLCSPSQKKLFLRQVLEVWDSHFGIFGRDESFYDPVSNMGALRCSLYEQFGSSESDR